MYGINQGGLGLVSGNYDLAYQGNNLTITKALLNVIADGKTKVYGDADPSLTYQVSGLKNGDSAGSILTGGLNRAAGENVGVYGINQGDLALNSGNYDLSYQGNNLTITKALLNVIADGKTKVYGDADPSLTYQVSGLKNGDSAGSILTGGLNRDAGENVGVYGINQGGLVLTSGNYDLAYQGNDLTITKALLNVFADAKSKQVGTADPALTYQVSGLKNGDSAGQVLAGGLGRVGGEAVGQYDILQGGLALTSGNYQLNYQGNLLSILPLPVTPGDLGQLAALSDLRELQKGRDPDTPGMRSTAPPRWKTRSSKTRSCAPTLWAWTSAILTCCRLPPRVRRRTPAPSGWGSSPIVRSEQRPRVGRVARTRATWPTTGAASTSL